MSRCILTIASKKFPKGSFFLDFLKNLRKEIFFREGGRGEPPYPPYHKNLGCQGEIAKPGCQGKSFDANFLEKDLASLGSSAHAIRMKIENEIKWSDLENIETEGRTMADVCLTSAFHKVWDRELTDDELDLVASEFQHEIYMMMLDRR